MNKLPLQKRKMIVQLLVEGTSLRATARLAEDFFTREGISNEAVAPKDTRTKVPAPFFMKLTGWKKPGSEHSRDAGMLCFGY